MKRTLLFVCAAIVTFFTLTQPTIAFFSKSGVPSGLEDGKATVVLKAWCMPHIDCPEPPAGMTWEEAIQDAVDTWNSAGADFVFETRVPLPEEYQGSNFCWPEDGAIILVFTDSLSCNGMIDDLSTWGANTKRGFGVSPTRIYYNNFLQWSIYEERRYPYAADDVTDPYEYVWDFRRFAVHELGHALGLDHPNEHGQNVQAIMNGNTAFLSDELYEDDIAGIQYLYGVREESTNSILGVLENPTEGREVFVSGISVLSGWVCEAEDITIRIYSGSNVLLAIYDAAYGTERVDTQGVCGDSNNGFGLLLNWNLFLSDQQYFVVAEADGEEIGRSTVTVTSFGEEFLRGAPQTEFVLDNFPKRGESVIIQWQETLQNFVIKEVQ